MILADKLIQLRKNNGWSQEELAEKVNVSRQAVAKWEGAQAVPNIDKLLQLSRLFGVTTDYLLKDEIEQEDFIEGADNSAVKRITLAEADEFLKWRKSASVRIAAATFLCILAVIPLLILSVASECFPDRISEGPATFTGLTVLLLLVAAAVAIFVFCGFRNAPYDFLDEGGFDIEYGVKKMVRERQNAYKKTYALYNTIGTCICILSPIPLFAGSFTEDDFFMVTMLAVTLLLVGIGVVFFTVAGVRWASMQKLLCEGSFARSEEQKNKLKDTIAAIYWPTAAAIYLGYSFFTDNWDTSWIVWPVAGLLFGAIMALCNLLPSRESKPE